MYYPNIYMYMEINALYKKWQRRNTRIIHVQVIKLLYFIWYLYNNGTLNFRNFNTDLRTI